MKLAKKCAICPTEQQNIILGCLTYAARKLWNIGNYERHNWSKDSKQPYPNWYDQKKRLKDHFWYKSLPSQSAQELLHILDNSWESFYKLQKSKGIDNPKPPRYKHSNFNIKFLNKGFAILPNNKIRFSLPKQLKIYLKEKYGIQENFLIVNVPKHLQLETDKIKIVEIKPIEKGKYEFIFVTEVSEVKLKPKTDKIMSIDIGVSNLLTCYTYDGSSYIYSGRQLLSINRYFEKTIGYYQSIAWGQQEAKGNKYYKATKRMSKLYLKRKKQVDHLLHAISKQVVDLAISKQVDTIVIGNINGIRENKNFGSKTNQKFHKLPYAKLISLITYKAIMQGVNVDNDTTEEYSSQTCCICKDRPSKANAVKSNRKHRGLYICRDCGTVINADVNGAVNINKKYLESLNFFKRPVVVLGTPEMYKFNGLKFIA